MLLRNYFFIADENIPPKVEYLRSTGINVFDIKEEGLSSTSDSAIIQLAVETQRIILTQDSDFGTFFFKEGFRFTGVIYIRPGHVKYPDLIRILSNLLTQEIDVKVPFIIVAELQTSKIKIRLREM